MNNLILPKIKEIIFTNTGAMPVEEIIESTTIEKDLDMDSLDIVEFAMSLESEFGIDLREPDYWSWETVADVLKTVEEKLK